MANCGNLKEGDIITCTDCGLELKVIKTCNCGEGGDSACHDVMQCCGKGMEPKKAGGGCCGCGS
jgi:hypothetical protein